MFKKMRRKDRELTRDESLAILAAGTEGVLATTGPEGFPYAIPLNYAFKDPCIYFHSAPTGHKIQNMAFNPKVCFCVTAQSRIIPEEFATRYQSVVVFGRAEEVHGDEKIEGLRLLVKQLSPDHMAAGENYIKNALDKTRVFKIRVEHISGKARR